MCKRYWNAWVVRSGLSGGYMPDNVAYFPNKKDALSYLAEEKRNIRDDGYILTGAYPYYSFRWPDQDYDPYCVVIDYMSFATKAERDQFIAENSEF